MSDMIKQIIAALMLAGLLGSVVAVRYSQKSRTENTLDKSEALKRYLKGRQLDPPRRLAPA